MVGTNGMCKLYYLIIYYIYFKAALALVHVKSCFSIGSDLTKQHVNDKDVELARYAASTVNKINKVQYKH